ncbi:MAG: hypothetical protein FGM33_07680 [Candidatus Kapabacteria bacterium]|nr:hypothetical protein [Candidatus Kapabacteria bacterium]
MNQQFQQGFQVQFGRSKDSLLSQVLLGLAVALFGVAMLLDRLGMPEMYSIVRDWWPTGIIVYAAIRLVTGAGSTFWSGLTIIVMTVIQLKKLGVVDQFWGVFWPLILIILGIWIVATRFRARGSAKPPTDMPGASYRVDEK